MKIEFFAVIAWPGGEKYMRWTTDYPCVPREGDEIEFWAEEETEFEAVATKVFHNVQTKTPVVTVDESRFDSSDEAAAFIQELRERGWLDG